MGVRKCVTVGLSGLEHCNNSPLKLLKAQNHYASPSSPPKKEMLFLFIGT